MFILFEGGWLTDSMCKRSETRVTILKGSCHLIYRRYATNISKLHPTPYTQITKPSWNILFTYIVSNLPATALISYGIITQLRTAQIVILHGCEYHISNMSLIYPPGNYITYPTCGKENSNSSSQLPLVGDMLVPWRVTSTS